MDLKTEKYKFLNGQFFSLTISAAFRQGRGNPVYKRFADENLKKSFRQFLENKLEGYESVYKNTISGDQHIQNIKSFQQEIIKKYKPILFKDNIGFGRVQKLINLYLKYLWIIEKISTPPHCPFDSIIISELKTNVPAWTKQSFTEDDYKKLVGLAEVRSKNISEWELNFWNKYLENRGEVL